MRRIAVGIRAEGLDGGGLGAVIAAQCLVGEGGRPGQLSRGEDRQPRQCRGGWVDAVVGALGGRQTAGGRSALGGASPADGEAGVQQGGEMRVLAGAAVVQGDVRSAQEG
ncbi:hypothetical protein [Streptomyces sp. NPDC005930]|uniref:hypothetical protein n=1 Tax=Streptomyces sp. NPDC005930 TaxID=3364736 RepID=UPI0036A7CA3A